MGTLIWGLASTGWSSSSKDVLDVLTGSWIVEESSLVTCSRGSTTPEGFFSVEKRGMSGTDSTSSDGAILMEVANTTENIGKLTPF